MQDTAGRFARQFAKTMRKAGRPDLAALEGPFCKAFCNNDLCMAVLERSGRFIRYSDKVDGAYCHGLLLNTAQTSRK